MRHQIALLAGMGFAVAAPAIAIAQSALPEIKRQSTAQAVLDEHMDALNHCDWNRIVAQYPDDAQINLPGGAVVAGRKAIGEMFAGFCKDSKDGGLKGINFKVEPSTPIGDTFATQWVANVDFLAEPYRGSDAYITKNGLMQAMVTTFDGGALKMKKGRLGRSGAGLVVTAEERDASPGPTRRRPLSVAPRRQSDEIGQALREWRRRRKDRAPLSLGR